VDLVPNSNPAEVVGLGSLIEPTPTWSSINNAERQSLKTPVRPLQGHQLHHTGLVNLSKKYRLSVPRFRGPQAHFLIYYTATPLPFVFRHKQAPHHEKESRGQWQRQHPKFEVLKAA
jgi:hypothetical protein